MWGGAIHPPTAKLAFGEVGALKAIEKVPASSAMPAHANVVIEYEGGTFSGLLIVDDLEFLDTVHRTLNGCIGRAISEIGSLELD